MIGTSRAHPNVTRWGDRGEGGEDGEGRGLGDGVFGGRGVGGRGR